MHEPHTAPARSDRSPEIPDAMDGLRRSRDALGAAVSVLTARLTTVLREETPQTGADANIAAIRATELGQGIAHEARELDSLTRFLVDLVDRIEV